MRKREFDAFFGAISRELPVSLLAQPPNGTLAQDAYAVSGSLPVFDAVDLLEKYGVLVLPDGRVVSRERILKRPLRIAFFVMLTELESKLYRTQEWAGRPLRELNDAHLNDLIRDLVNDETLFGYQKVYDSRSAFKEDLKAISSVRNLVVHVNKKLEMETDFATVVHRKHQMDRLISALNQVLDAQEEARAHGQEKEHARV